MTNPKPLNLKLNIRTQMPLRNFPFWAGLLFFAIYLLVLPATVSSVDELALLTAADNMVQYHHADINLLAWSAGQENAPGAWDDAGNFRLTFGKWLIWLYVPLMGLAHLLPGLNPLQLGLLTNGVLLAVITALIAWALMRRGLLPRPVLTSTLLFGGLALFFKFDGETPPPLWLHPTDFGLPVQLYLLLPPAILLLAVAGNLYFGWRGQKTLPVWAASLLTVWLAGQFLFGAGHFSARQARPADTAVFAALKTAPATDSLWIALPPAADRLEFSAWWLGNRRERQPTTLLPADAAAVAQVPLPAADSLWLYERGQSPADPPTAAAARLAADAFPLDEQWFTGGRLSRYAHVSSPLPEISAAVPFDGGISLEKFAVTAPAVSAGDVLGVRLQWRRTAAADAPLVAFVHLLGADGALAVQQDRLLFDPQFAAQFPPDVPQWRGYGLQLPDDLPAGDYSLVVGVYRQPDGVRLARADGSPDDFLYLTTISVKRE